MWEQTFTGADPPYAGRAEQTRVQHSESRSFALICLLLLCFHFPFYSVLFKVDVTAVKLKWTYRVSFFQRNNQNTVQTSSSWTGPCPINTESFPRSWNWDIRHYIHTTNLVLFEPLCTSQECLLGVSSVYFQVSTAANPFNCSKSKDRKRVHIEDIMLSPTDVKSLLAGLEGRWIFLCLMPVTVRAGGVRFSGCPSSHLGRSCKHDYLKNAWRSLLLN